MNKASIRIGFDFDKVFADYPPLIPSKVINYLYKKHNHKLSYRIPGRFEQKIRVLSHHTFFRPPIKRNIEALKKITKEKDLEIFLISSRFQFLKERTEKWLNKNNFKKYFKELYFNFENQQPHLFKDDIINKLKIKKYIDDDLHLLMYLAQKHPEIDFYWIENNFDKDKFDLPSTIIPIKDLEEFCNKYI
ncbi:hypothetical protein C4577_01380 [Candidatus Parcubacteria bacterium]|nr:MAG: hypothetical protein C4577_01380 [Candidatus Parcubacteria bacterium]